MKQIKFVIFILFLICSNGLSQIDTLEALSYFPLQTGNIWQYQVVTMIDPPTDTSYVIFSVIGDSIMPNGKKYKIMENDWIAYRIDTTELKVYLYEPYIEGCPDSEIVYFDLNFPDSGSYSTCFPYQVNVDSGFGFAGYLSIEASYISYKWYYGINYTYKLSKDIGISEWSWWELGGSHYTLIASKVNGKQYGDFVSGILDNDNAPSTMSLFQNFPNPFNPSTTISFYLANREFVQLNVYNTLGETIKSLINGWQTAGLHKIVWDGTNNSNESVPSGVYFYTLKNNFMINTKKMVLIR